MSPSLAQASLVLLSLSSLSSAYTPSSNEKRHAALSHHHTFARRQEGLGAVESPGSDFSGFGGSLLQIVGEVGMGMRKIVKKAHVPSMHGEAKNLLEYVAAANPIAVPVNTAAKTHHAKHHKHHHTKTAHHAAHPTAAPTSLDICPIVEVFNSTALWFEATGQSGACGITTKDTDMIMGLSTDLWDDDDGMVSDYCGQSVILTNTATGKNITVTIADNSGKAEYITLSKSAYTALGDMDAGMFPASYQFVDFNATLLSSASGSSVPVATQPKPNQLSVAKASSEAAPTTSSFEAPSAPVTTSSSQTPPAAPTSTFVAPAPAPKPTTTQAPPPPAPTTKAPPPPAPTTTAAPAPSSEVFSGGAATFFTQNGVAGACGTVHSDSVLLVAIDQARYNNGSNCGRSVHITNTANGKTVVATVQDECPTCNVGTIANDLDLSLGAFNAIGDQNTGVLPIVWFFLD